MGDVERLLEAFESGALLRPDPAIPNLVDLGRALATAVGIDGLDLSAAARTLTADIGDHQHVVFVLVDGMGMSLLEHEPGTAYLRGSLHRELRSTFPSTTAVALTSLATGEWATQHAVTGWWTYLPSIEDTATVLPYVRRSDDRPLRDLGVTPEHVFPVPSLWSRVPRQALCVQPARIADSVYSRYANGSRACMGYRALRDGFDAVLEHVEAATGPAYTYLYLPHVDASAHEYGLESPELHGALMSVDRELKRLVELLAGRARLVLTADHGHLSVPEERRHRMSAKDPLSDMLSAVPSGDLRVVSFHVQPGRHEAFAAAFRARYGRRFVLLTVDEVERLELLGPGSLSPQTRRRLGEYAAFSLADDILVYADSHGERHALQQPSHHSGLTPQEMRVPLVLA